MRSVFCAKVGWRTEYDLFPIIDYNYSREGAAKSSLRTERLFRIKQWSKVYISCSQINHRFLPFNSSWSSTVSSLLPRHTIQFLQSHLPWDTQFLILTLLSAWYEAGSTHKTSAWCFCHTAPFFLCCGASSQNNSKLLACSSASQKLHCESAFIFASLSIHSLHSHCYYLPSLSLLCGAYMCVW